MIDKTLIKALSYSLLCHLLLFTTFRIRLNDFHDYSHQMLPIAVAIESEAPTTQVVRAQDLDRESLFIANLDVEEWKAMNLNLVRCDQNLDTPPKTLSPCALDAITEDDVRTLAPKISYAPKMYPLQLKLSKELKALQLVEDGSSLFRDKGPYDDLGRFILTANHFPIEYQVTVDAATGRILEPERKYELLDKELQALADRLIPRIRFAPFSAKSVKGSITLVFCCSGDEIKGLMHD